MMGCMFDLLRVFVKQLSGRFHSFANRGLRTNARTDMIFFQHVKHDIEKKIICLKFQLSLILVLITKKYDLFTLNILMS